FLVGRVHRYLKLRTRNTSHQGEGRRLRLGHLTAEVLEPSRSRNASKDLRAKRIALRHLQLAIRRDELSMFVRMTIAGGGILQFIHKNMTAGRINKLEGVPAA
ncbi:hypothetical protein EDB86DRAFT_2819473, partial [Lactarius hatsudake]